MPARRVWPCITDSSGEPESTAVIAGFDLVSISLTSYPTPVARFGPVGMGIRIDVGESCVAMLLPTGHGPFAHSSAKPATILYCFVGVQIASISFSMSKKIEIVMIV